MNSNHSGGKRSSKGDSRQGNKQSASSTSNRGFAAMDPDRQRSIAAEGGRAAHERGTAHEFTSDEAREAGRKGGEANHGNAQSASKSGSDSASAGSGSGSASGNNGSASGNNGSASGNNGSGAAGNQGGSTSTGRDSAARSPSKGVQGGTPEQHAAAGRQSHKNDGK